MHFIMLWLCKIVLRNNIHFKRDLQEALQYLCFFGLKPVVEKKIEGWHYLPWEPLFRHWFIRCCVQIGHILYDGFTEFGKSCDRHWMHPIRRSVLLWKDNLSPMFSQNPHIQRNFGICILILGILLFIYWHQITIEQLLSGRKMLHHTTTSVCLFDL